MSYLLRAMSELLKALGKSLLDEAITRLARRIADLIEGLLFGREPHTA